MDLAFESVLFLAGLAFGSFLNVAISRIPRDESVVSPRSHCRSCGAPIRWRDNIPLLSWLLLRGRCRDCRAQIPWRYPLVELLTALGFVACYFSFGFGWSLLKFCVFVFLLIGLIFMDAETGLLPREFTWPGIVLGLLSALVAPPDAAGTRFLLRLYNAPNALPPPWVAVLDSLLGALVGAGFFYLAWALYYLARKRHGMGFGDLALMAMAGAFLGLKLIVFVIFASPIVALGYGIVTLASHREDWLKREIPFGVFIGSCSLAATFFGEAVWNWYLGFFR